MKKKENNSDVEEVKLKPFLGMRPGLWITLLFVLSILLILFILLVLPGLITTRAYAHFTFNLSNVAIYSDGRYIGSSKSNILTVEPGVNSYEFYTGDILLKSEEIDMKKGIFCSLFRRKINEVYVEAEKSDEIVNYTKESFAENIAKWTEITDFKDKFFFPPLFEDFAHDAISLGLSDISDIWLYGAEHITSNEAYQSYKNGETILKDSNIKYSTEDLERLEESIEAMFSSDETLTVNSPNEPTYEKAEKNGKSFVYQEGEVHLGHDVDLKYPDTNEYPVILSTPSFAISGKLVTESEYKAFLDENPYWDISNVDNLISDGMVDENYLKGVSFSRSTQDVTPIRSISYYAAEAYIDWLGKKENKKYSLLTEAEWTRAAKSSSKKYLTTLRNIDTDDSEPSSLLGGLWEFTSTPYIPLMRLSNYDKALSLEETYPYDDVIIKGGSYINDPESIDENTVGVISKERTSEYVGFRVKEIYE